MALIASLEISKLVSERSVVKFGVHVVKTTGDVGKIQLHVGKIATHVGIPYTTHQHFTKKAAERSEQSHSKSFKTF